MSAGAALSAVAGVGGSLFNTIYSMYRNSITDQRDDTAIQRRVKDLEAAGLNPLLAAGQGANTTLGMSTNLDTSGVGNFAQNLYDLKNSRETYKQNQLYTRLMENELNRSNLDNYIYNQQMAAMTGLSNDAMVSRRGYNFNYGMTGNLKQNMSLVESLINGKKVQSWSNPAYNFDSIVQSDSDIFNNWISSLKNQSKENYRQSVFNLKTQNYQNYLNLVQGTINPLVDMAGMFKGLPMVPFTTQKRFTK